MNFNQTKIRCSSLSCLFTEPQSKEDKLAGRLSKTAKTHLYKVYAKELWGVEKDILTKPMQKGVEAEDDAILLLSKVDGWLYEKNGDRHENDYISGHPDIIFDDTVIDIKCSWDALTFLPNITEEVSKEYYYQVQGYMWLMNKQKARIVYCLVDTPQGIINGEAYNLFRRMDCVTELDPKYVEALKKLTSNMVFSHIPEKHRVISQFVDRDEEIIEKIPSKVEKAREFLQEVYEKHMNLVPLVQNDAT
jgi:hypothetical protein